MLSADQEMYLGQNKKTMHCFIEDIQYLQFLQIKFKVLQIICTVGCANSKFQQFCKDLIEMKSKSTLSKMVCKDIAICGLGRFAMSVAKNNNTNRQITVYEKKDLQNLISFDMLDGADTIGHHMTCKLKHSCPGQTAFQRRKNAFKFSLSSTLFALSVNATRREMHRLFLYLKLHNIKAIRADTDCLSLKYCIKDVCKIDSFMEKSQFDFQQENQKEIYEIQNFSKGSYQIIYVDGTRSVKTPG